jgi:hypothetical protein
MDKVPNEILRHILFFLTNDGAAVGRLALCSSTLHKRVMEQQSDVWEALVRNRWRRGALGPSESGQVRREENGSDDPDPYDFQWEYVRRHRIDVTATERLEEMTRCLHSILQLNDETPLMNGNDHVGQAWDHPAWRDFLQQGFILLDVLHAKAQPAPALPTAPNDTDVDRDGHTEDDGGATCVNSRMFNRLFRFLAARCFQNVYFANCLLEWKQLHEMEQQASRNADSSLKSQLDTSRRLERWAFLVCKIQRTPLELLHENYKDVEQRAIERLDEIAGACRKKIAEISPPYKRRPSVAARMNIVNSILTDNYGFSGNEEDYYNYHNSLLDRVLESKKGIPMTLCILYACICQRLDIPVLLIGLPGRMVLGFDNNDNDIDKCPGNDGCKVGSSLHRQKRIFMDVFHGGRFLTIADCQDLAASYGVPWQYVSLAPLRNEMALQRIMDNLTNCHSPTAAQRSPFRSDLVFQQRALQSICDQPPTISRHLVDRVARDLPLTLSTDLLRA